jgi:hypothetical protein
MSSLMTFPGPFGIFHRPTPADPWELVGSAATFGAGAQLVARGFARSGGCWHVGIAPPPAGAPDKAPSEEN